MTCPESMRAAVFSEHVSEVFIAFFGVDVGGGVEVHLPVIPQVGLWALAVCLAAFGTHWWGGIRNRLFRTWGRLAVGVEDTPRPVVVVLWIGWG